MKALITGASSGIGRDMARVLAARGCDLILVARRQERLEQLAEELTVHCRIITLDLSKRENCRRLYDLTKDDGVNILINNAGFGLFGPFADTDLDRELEMLDTNIGAVHILTKLFYRDFVAKDRGYILNVASTAAFLPGPLLSTYYASKAYVLRLTQALHEELRRRGSRVRVSVLCPGPVRTEFDEVANVSFGLKGLDSADVAAYAIDRMLAGQLVIVPGLLLKMTRVASHLLPDKLLTRVAYRIQKKKQG